MPLWIAESTLPKTYLCLLMTQGWVGFLFNVVCDIDAIEALKWIKAHRGLMNPYL